MKRALFVLALVLHYGAVYTQNEWVLQPFLEVIGDSAGGQLGQFVAGIGNNSPNNPYNVAIAAFFKMGLYAIDSPDDTLPQRVYFGHNLRRGDLNGDGYTDLIIRQRFDYYAHDTVFVYPGNRTGIDTIASLKIAEDTSYSEFGLRMCVGDLNRDGCDDLVVTAGEYPEALLQGKVYIFMGRATLSPIPDHVMVGDTLYSGLGWNCTIGDLNHDGYGDLVVSGYDATDPHPDSGNRFSYLKVYFGSAQFDVGLDLYLKGSRYAQFGLACFDVNGDGIADLLWENPEQAGPYRTWGAVFIYFGGTYFDLSPDFVITNPDTESAGIAGFGFTLANAGDMDGDGCNDILIGAPYSFQSFGFVFVYRGGGRLWITNSMPRKVSCMRVCSAWPWTVSEM